MEQSLPVYKKSVQKQNSSQLSYISFEGYGTLVYKDVFYSTVNITHCMECHHHKTQFTFSSFAQPISWQREEKDLIKYLMIVLNTVKNIYRF